jgi:predicted transcriptional regulator
MERRPASIPRAEIPAEAIRYSDVRSRVEIASEVTPVVNFRNADMKILYEDLGMSSKSVGRAVGLSKSYVSQLMHNQRIVMRDSSDPIYLDRRIEATRRAYDDPEKKAEIVAKIHKLGSKKS